MTLSVLPIKTDLSDLNEEQRLAVTSESMQLLVLAGAGSRKTKTLLQKIIYLIEEKGVSPSSILAITFTKNAANEMIDRLIIAADKSGEYQKALSDKKISLPAKDIIRQEYRNKYKWISGLTIRSCDSFCYRVIKRHGAKEVVGRFSFER